MIKNNTPRLIQNGVKDESVVALVPEREQIPQHLPLGYLLAQRGFEYPVLCSPSGDLTRIYGDETFNVRGIYFNHATALMREIAAEGNFQFTKRVKPMGAKSSKLTLVAVVDSASVVKKYFRGTDGKVVLDANGSPTFRLAADYIHDPLGTPETFDKATTPVYFDGTNYTVIAVTVSPGTARTVPAANVADVVGGKLITYQVVDTDVAYPALTFPTGPAISNGAVTTYPIISCVAGSFGKYGDNVGLRLWTARPDTASAGDSDVISDQSALIFNAQLVERPAVNKTPVIQDTIGGSKVVQFCLKPGAYDYKTNLDLPPSRIVTEYNDDGLAAGTAPTLGPLSEFTVHQSSLETLLGVLKVAEEANDEDIASTLLVNESSTSYDIYMLDLFGGIDQNGRHHYGFQVSNAGARVVESSTHYLLGGSDGNIATMTAAQRDAEFASLVETEIDSNYQNPAYPLLDEARYPFSVVYDSGFPVATKQKLYKWTSYRKDVHVAVGTHEIGQSLTVDQEESVATTLRAAANLYAESAVHGTGPLRIAIFGHSGELLNSDYKARCPLTFEIAKKRARYMGAGNGKMKLGLGYDKFPLNKITSMKNVNNTWLTQTKKESIWDKGVNFVQYVDRADLFFPALQTVYAIKNSVLTSEVLMNILVDVTKMSQQVWRELSGISDLTQDQFKEKSDKRLLELVDGRYDDRVIIIPNTYFTPADTARGYSWVQDIVVEGNNMKTVGQVNVIVRRQ